MLTCQYILATYSLKNSINGGDRLECKFYDQMERILVTEGSSSMPEVTYDVQEIIVGDQLPEDQTTREAHDEESDLKFLGHTGMEGTAVIVNHLKSTL